MAKQPKTERLQIRMTPEQYELAASVADEIGLDMSATVILLLTERARTLGLLPAAPTKKRRSVPPSGG